MQCLQAPRLRRCLLPAAVLPSRPPLPRWRENPYKTARAIETVKQAGFDFEGQE